jgi:hypothetical protein
MPEFLILFVVFIVCPVSGATQAVDDMLVSVEAYTLGA